MRNTKEVIFTNDRERKYLDQNPPNPRHQRFHFRFDEYYFINHIHAQNPANSISCCPPMHAKRNMPRPARNSWRACVWLLISIARHILDEQHNIALQRYDYNKFYILRKEMFHWNRIKMTEKSIIIIGAGLAGLSTVLLTDEWYSKPYLRAPVTPGGVATCWKRKGYTNRWRAFISWFVTGQGNIDLWYIPRLGTAQPIVFSTMTSYCRFIDEASGEVYRSPWSGISWQRVKILLRLLIHDSSMTWSQAPAPCSDTGLWGRWAWSQPQNF